MKSTVSSKGQITVPAKIRSKLGLAAGTHDRPAPGVPLPAAALTPHPLLGGGPGGGPNPGRSPPPVMSEPEKKSPGPIPDAPLGCSQRPSVASRPGCSTPSRGFAAAPPPGGGSGGGPLDDQWAPPPRSPRPPALRPPRRPPQK